MYFSGDFRSLGDDADAVQKSVLNDFDRLINRLLACKQKGADYYQRDLVLLYRQRSVIFEHCGDSSLNTQERKNFYGMWKRDCELALKEAEGILNAALSDGYNTSIYSYEWGSNGTIADNGNLLMMAYDISKDHAYRQMAVEQLNYLLGKNSLNMSFVSGYGYNSPKNVHHRLSEFKNITLNGVLVGGPNNSREDTITSQIGTDIPPAKVYADNYESYSTNEMSIYWNASLIHLISSLR